MENNKGTKIKYFLIGAAAALAAAFLIFLAVLRLPVSSYVEDPTSLDAYKKTVEMNGYIDRYYLGEVDKKSLADYMYLGMVTGLEDPYSTYFTKEEFEQVNMTQQGEYRGIGITITTRVEDGALMISTVTEGGPAQRAGISDGDLILTINGNDFSHATSSEAAEYVRGLEDDSLEITVFREETNEELSFTVAIEALEDRSVSYSMTDGEIGYIYISSFTGNTAKQFSQARQDLESQGMKALIIDLRDNPGGLVSAVTDVLKSFMPESLLFYTEDKYGKGSQYFSEGSNPLEVPLAVLVNGNTASASEIFSGAVKDHQAGTLVGTVTYGKGIVQNAYTLSDGSVLRITVSHYYTPNGNDIHTYGITPDIIAEDTADDSNVSYEKARELLLEQISK